MKKTMILVLLALTLCLSACTNTPQADHSADPTPPATEQTTPAPEESSSASTPSEEAEAPQQTSAVEYTETEEPADVAQPGPDEAPADSTDAPEVVPPADEQPATTDAPQPQPDAEPTPDAAPEQTPAAETESPSAAEELNKEDILVEFEGETINFSDPFRLYTLLWTTTYHEDEYYYAIAPDTSFTVTNNGESDAAYITIQLTEYLRINESFMAAINHGDGIFEADLMGQYWNENEYHFLSDQIPSKLSAGEGLYWVLDEGSMDYSQWVRLYPGESITFHLPEREQDAVYSLGVCYRNDAGDYTLPRKSFLVTADDITVPHIES